MSFLSVENITKNLGNGFVLHNISLQQKQFQKIAIAGETGSGKSTLLKTIAGIVQPDSGNIFFKEKKVLGPDYKLLPGHEGIAYLSQHYELPNNYRVEELLGYANKLTKEEANILYKICRIDHLLKRRTNQLSGGEKQLIALARLLTTSPALFLLDEPFSNLDNIRKSILKTVIRNLGELPGISFIIVSHDPLDTLSWADEMIILREGKIQQRGCPQSIYYCPANEYTAGLLGDYNLLKPATAQLFGVDGCEENKKLFLRPEMLLIAEEKNNSVKGIVQNVYFSGSGYELEILVSGEKIKLKTSERSYRKGDRVSIALKTEENLWFIESITNFM